ncbi:CACTA en-spm transposon protein [Cucumis melo var. makuwa]|uniref:CACTA en-spm transposon protein n=1 Tax=Cucumis melo var. makuwa TaxID=1194695 RepID=A0A5A7SLN2_CUCMM|nr:CACTA en-spm transposon protein [Cucumis melo var. makuwa]
MNTLRMTFYADLTLILQSFEDRLCRYVANDFIDDAETMRHQQSRLLKLESKAINVCVRRTFPVHFFRWVNVGREYIKVIKDDLQEFKSDCHRHFTKYSYLEQACANPPHILVGRTKGWHFLFDHYMSRAFQSNHRRTRLLDKSSLTIIAAGTSRRFYSDSISSLSNEVNQSIVWSYSSKHTFDMARHFAGR